MPLDRASPFERLVECLWPSTLANSDQPAAINNRPRNAHRKPPETSHRPTARRHLHFATSHQKPIISHQPAAPSTSLFKANKRNHKRWRPKAAASRRLCICFDQSTCPCGWCRWVVVGVGWSVANVQWPMLPRLVRSKCQKSWFKKFPGQHYTLTAKDFEEQTKIGYSGLRGRG